VYCCTIWSNKTPIKSPAAKRLCVVKTPVLYAKKVNYTPKTSKRQRFLSPKHQAVFFFLNSPLAQTTNEQTSPQGQSVTNVTKKKLQFGKHENNEYHYVNEYTSCFVDSKIKIWILPLKDSGSNTSAMRYSEETKEFFWTGKRLLGGQFIRYMQRRIYYLRLWYMQGLTHEGRVKERHSDLGYYDPEESDIILPYHRISNCYWT